MTTSSDLPGRVAANVRAEMAAQKRTAVQLAANLHLGHRAALRRMNGDIPFSLGETEQVAQWLGVSVSFLTRRRQPAEVAA